MPFESIEKTAISFDLWPATNIQFPVGSTLKFRGKLTMAGITLISFVLSPFTSNTEILSRFKSSLSLMDVYKIGSVGWNLISAAVRFVFL